MKKTLLIIGLAVVMAGCSQEENVKIEYEVITGTAIEEMNDYEESPPVDIEPERETNQESADEEMVEGAEEADFEETNQNDLSEDVSQRFPEIFTFSSLVTNLITDIEEDKIIINKHAVNEEIYEQYQYFYIPPSDRTSNEEYLFKLNDYQIGETNAVLDIELQNLEDID